MAVNILYGDCRQVLPTIPEKSVHCCVTSPPYYGLRDYGCDGQIGLEQTPEDFVNELVMVFRGIRRVLRDDGTLWLNLGDSYSRSPRKGGSGPNGKNENRWGYGVAQSAKIGSSDGVVGRSDRPGSRSGGLGEKQLLGIPWRVALALQEDGWYLRQDIIWHKPNPMPESVKDRCTKAHEYIFLLSKSERYYFDHEAIKEPCADVSIARRERADLRQKKGWSEAYQGNPPKGLSNCQPSETRNKRSVWTVATQPYKEAHFATFPEKLIEPCILAGCPEDGTVIDPFGGSGTTAVVAMKNYRSAVLIDNNIEYIGLQYGRIGATL